MNTKGKHTELPWEVTKDGMINSIKDDYIPIFSPWREDAWEDDPKEAQANARFIVQACNNFEALREALESVEKELLCAFEDMATQKSIKCDMGVSEWEGFMPKAWHTAKQALANSAERNKP